MNCANHTNVSAVAYCRTCGKPLCATCTRDVRGVIYCDNCLAARLEGQPAAASGLAAAPILPAAPIYTQPAQGGPNPALAGILAGFFPFGVGAVYDGQYAKGLAHLVIFVLLIMGMNHGDGLATFCGLAFAFFYVYQIIDAVRSARAIQIGQPAPDPFGLGQAFGAGEKLDVSKVPTAAVVLIGIGILFLLETMGLFSFDFDRIWPIFLILLGGWLFVRNSGLMGDTSFRGRRLHRGHPRLMGPAVLVTIGVLSLLENTTRFGWDRTWPVFILVIGIVLLLQSSGFGGRPGTPGPGTPETGAVPGSSPGTGTESPRPPANEVRNV
jgi:hypothetical protein